MINNNGRPIIIKAAPVEVKLPSIDCSTEFSPVPKLYPHKIKNKIIKVIRIKIDNENNILNPLSYPGDNCVILV